MYYVIKSEMKNEYYIAAHFSKGYFFSFIIHIYKPLLSLKYKMLASIQETTFKVFHSFLIKPGETFVCLCYITFLPTQDFQWLHVHRVGAI